MKYLLTLNLFAFILLSGIELHAMDIDSLTSGMGTVYDASSSDVRALHYNPAAVSGLFQKDVVATTALLPGDRNYYDASIAVPADFGVFHAGITYINQRTSPSLDSFAGIFGYSFPVYEDTRLTMRNTIARAGVNLKVLNMAVSGINSTVLAADLGLTYKLDVLDENLTLGLKLADIGGEYEFSGIKTALDTSYDLDVSYKDIVFGLNGALKIGKIIDGETFYGLGASYNIVDNLTVSDYVDRFDVRAGISDGNESDPRFSLGFSVYKYDISLDYALIPKNNDAGTVNILSLSSLFGARKKDFNDIEVLYNEAISNYMSGQLQTARQYFERVEIMRGDYKQTKKYINNIRRFTSQLYKERPVTAKESSKTKVMKEKADAFFEAGKYTEAIKYYTAVLMVDKSNSDAKQKLEDAKQLLIDRTVSRKQKKSEKEVAAFDNRMEKYYSAGQRLFEDKKYNQALTQYRLGRNSVSKSSAWYSKFSKAEKKTKVRIAENYYEKGYIYYQQNKFEESVDQFTEALKYNPDYEAAKEKVREVKVKIDQINKNKAVKLYEKGMDEYTAGNVDEAVKLWEEALELDKNHVEASKALERVRAIKRP